MSANTSYILAIVGPIKSSPSDLERFFEEESAADGLSSAASVISRDYGFHTCTGPPAGNWRLSFSVFRVRFIILHVQVQPLLWCRLQAPHLHQNQLTHEQALL